MQNKINIFIYGGIMRDKIKGYIGLKSVRVILMVAVLTLFLLGAYVYYLNNKYN